MTNKTYLLKYDYQALDGDTGIYRDTLYRISHGENLAQAHYAEMRREHAINMRQLTDPGLQSEPCELRFTIAYNQGENSKIYTLIEATLLEDE
jgi:hypothetical protein